MPHRPSSELRKSIVWYSEALDWYGPSRDKVDGRICLYRVRNYPDRRDGMLRRKVVVWAEPMVLTIALIREFQLLLYALLQLAMVM